MGKTYFTDYEPLFLHEDLEEYIRQGEPEKTERSKAWQMAIGLQKVDGLDTSSYLNETAKMHIEGEITMAEAKQRIDSYYQSRTARLTDSQERTEEADKVSARIAELLGEQTFTLAPTELVRIHRHLFTGIYKHAGQIRDYNITKREWVLGGETVLYASASLIGDTLEYDIEQERKFSYENLSVEEAVDHIGKFISNVWQIHPFGEGNTRTTAVFLIKYLRQFGFEVNNQTFSYHSWFFRNALVRANYNDLRRGIVATVEPIRSFMRHLLFKEKTDLRNRTLHVDWKPETEFQSAKSEVSKCQIGTLDCTLEEMAVLQVIKNKPNVTQKELAERTGKSERTIKRLTVSLTERGIIARKNGRRNGFWEVL